MRHKAALTALVLATSALTTAAQAGEFGKTCTYFENIAYNDRFTQDHVTFRMKLADDCQDALSIWEGARPGSVQHAMSGNYLQRLEDYRWTMIEMARERFRASRVGDSHAMGPVTRTGAFLIARTMGITATQTRWRDWRQAMAEGRVLIR
ncbi:hypothetical protein ACW9UR_02870 [Halovulum sp. GXIMD14794]